MPPIQSIAGVRVSPESEPRVRAKALTPELEPGAVWLEPADDGEFCVDRLTNRDVVRCMGVREVVRIG